MNRLLRWLGVRLDTPCANCGTRNLWALKHGDWCFYAILFARQDDDQ